MYYCINSYNHIPSLLNRACSVIFTKILLIRACSDSYSPKLYLAELDLTNIHKDSTQASLHRVIFTKYLLSQACSDLYSSKFYSGELALSHIHQKSTCRACFDSYSLKLYLDQLSPTTTWQYSLKVYSTELALTRIHQNSTQSGSNELRLTVSSKS